MTANAPHNVVFFDGVCVLCNGTVDLLIKMDKKRVLRYSSLQGEFARQALSTHQIESLASIVFWSDGIAYERVESIIHILIKLGGVYKFLGLVLKAVPLFISNFFYNLVARNRYRLFGKNETCRIPSSEEKTLFIP